MAQFGGQLGAMNVMNPLIQQMLIQQQALQGAGDVTQMQHALAMGLGGPQNAALLPPQQKKSKGDAGIIGLANVTMKALAPVAHMDPEWGLEEMAFKLCGFIGRAAAKYWKDPDERLSRKQPVGRGQALIEEFVEACLNNMHKACGHRPWFIEANLTDPLFHACMGTFESKQTMFMTRLLKPVIQKTIDDAIARYREEERISRVMWDAVQISGLPEAHQKTAYKHLQTSYDKAHMSAPYGSCTDAGGSAEMGLTQDFVKGWMQEFGGRAWHMMHEGVSPNAEEQYAWMTSLFQYITDPEQCCLPFELVSQPGAMPPENWEFVAEQTMAIVKPTTPEVDEEEPAKKKFKKNDYGGGDWSQW